jgi:hypothetical protein
MLKESFKVALSVKFLTGVSDTCMLKESFKVALSVKFLLSQTKELLKL